jgi:protein-S-isoprenylcysteine O-methyltransferase Ste14
MEEKINNGSVHRILARSYSFYFIGFLLGITLDFIFPLHLMSISWGSYLGLLFMIIGSIFIFWAQRANRDYIKDPKLTGRTFCHGPYCYTRSPTHVGIAILLIGFGILANAFFVVIFTLIAFLITKYTFLTREEAVLEKKYGGPYLEYKKLVKF